MKYSEEYIESMDRFLGNLLTANVFKQLPDNFSQEEFKVAFLNIFGGDPENDPWDALDRGLQSGLIEELEDSKFSSNGCKIILEFNNIEKNKN